MIRDIIEVNESIEPNAKEIGMLKQVFHVFMRMAVLTSIDLRNI